MVLGRLRTWEEWPQPCSIGVVSLYQGSTSPWKEGWYQLEHVSVESKISVLSLSVIALFRLMCSVWKNLIKNNGYHTCNTSYKVLAHQTSNVFSFHMQWPTHQRWLWDTVIMLSHLKQNVPSVSVFPARNTYTLYLHKYMWNSGRSKENGFNRKCYRSKNAITQIFWKKNHML